MSSAVDARDFQGRLQRLEKMLQEVEQSPDPTARTRTRAIIQAVLELHGAGLQRLLAHVKNAAGPGGEILQTCATDEVVAGLLLLHGLHPLDMETRVRQALEQARPYLDAHGGSVELIGIDDGVVRLKLNGNCNGCPSSSATMNHIIHEAIYVKAPDAERVEVEGAVAEEAARETSEKFALPLV